MFEIFQPGISLSWDLIWQSSLFLMLGLAASLANRAPTRPSSSRPGPDDDRCALHATAGPSDPPRRVGDLEATRGEGGRCTANDSHESAPYFG